MPLKPPLVATAAFLPEDFGRFQQHIPVEWITEALAATAPAKLRSRKLPAEQVMWLVIGMALFRNLPIKEIVRSLELVLPDANGDREVAPSAIPQARNRVGEKPLQLLFEKTGRAWSDAVSGEATYRGLTLWGMDGSCLEAPDSPDNREHFGGTKTHRGQSGYPLVRVVILTALRSTCVVPRPSMDTGRAR